MRNASVWRVLVCVESAVVEDIEFDDKTQVWWPMSGRGERAGVDAEPADRGPLGMTVVRGGGGGGGWTWEPPWSSWKLMRRG